MNFAISCTDIRSALEAAKKAQLLPLPEGAGKIASGHGDADPKAGELAADKIPPALLTSFVEQGQKMVPAMLSNERKQLKELQDQHKAMKSGVVNANFKRMFGEKQDVHVTKVKNHPAYVFPDKETKNRYIDDQAAQVKRCQARLDRIEKSGHPELVLLREIDGPPLTPNGVGQVGWLPRAKVAQVTSDDSVLFLVDDKPIEMRGVSGLANESIIPSMLVYVAGTQTYKTAKGASYTVLVVRALRGEVLQEFIEGKDSAAANPSR